MKQVKKLLIVFGTRPEAIKLAPLIHCLKENPDFFEIKICVTGQHREMLDQVLNIFKIVPDIDLNLMKKNQDLFTITAETLTSIKNVISDIRPDLVLVHGDTTTAFATSLACYYAGISVCHIEAGLRTNNVYAPFPEEFNRQVIAKIAKWHFAPTESCQKNLISEGISCEDIIVTGNTVIDSLYWMLKKIESDEITKVKISEELGKKLNFNWKKDKFILITGHRRENFGVGFKNICSALAKIAKNYRKIHFVYPVHLNPNVQQTVNLMLKGIPNIHLIEPLQYDCFVYLLKHCNFVLTDSGGIQEEAPSIGKPVMVMRSETERTEAIEAGSVILVGADENSIIYNVTNLIEDNNLYKKMSCAKGPYGNGFASQKIVQFIKNKLVLKYCN